MNSKKDKRKEKPSGNTDHPYIGMWITKDGYIRQELLLGGRYDEARGNRKSAFTGQYWIEDTHIEYKDDTGFAASGDFEGDILYHAGFILHRDKNQ